MDTLDDSTWTRIVAALDSPDVATCVEAAGRLHAEAGAGDVARLLALLRSDSAFAREAAAWPLARLSGAQALPELFAAYQRGFDEGHDNEGFSAALLEIPAAQPEQTRKTLARLIESADPATIDHARWLLEFC